MLLAMSAAVMAAEYQFTRSAETITVRTGTSGGDCLEDWNHTTQQFIGVSCVDGDALGMANVANGCSNVVFPGMCGVGEVPVELYAYGTLHCPDEVYFMSAGEPEDGGCDFSGTGEDRAGYCNDGEGNSQEADCENGCGNTEGASHCCCAESDMGCGQGPNCDGTPAE